MHHYVEPVEQSELAIDPTEFSQSRYVFEKTKQTKTTVPLLPKNAVDENGKA